MRRLLLLTAVFCLGPSLPTSAKLPPFEMEVETLGETVEVTVRIVADETLLHGFDSPDLDGLLAVFPAGQVDDEGRPQTVLEARADVPLSRVGPGTYQGSATVEPGHWAVVPFPGVNGDVHGTADGWYPNTVLFEVGDEGSQIWALAALAALTVVAWRLRDVARV
jgi:hypothetical protein